MKFDKSNWQRQRYLAQATKPRPRAKAKQLDSVPGALGQKKTLFYQERKVFQKSETKIEILFFQKFYEQFYNILINCSGSSTCLVNNYSRFIN